MWDQTLSCIAAGWQAIQINDYLSKITGVVAATTLFVIMDKPGPLLTFLGWQLFLGQS